MKTIGIKSIILFVVEVVIPFIAAPLLPSLINGCSEADAFIIGSCISIFIAIWTLSNKLNDNHGDFDHHRIDTIKGFDTIDRKLGVLETFLRFQDDLDKVASPYFKKRINYALQKNLEKFREDHKSLFDGYLETTPYSKDTYGSEGLKWTVKEILAVSSVQDYWDRAAFVTEYLKTQYWLVSDRSVKISRIFVGTKDKLKSMKRIMKNQHDHGIEVYFIESDSPYCAKEWINQDFLIQDDTLVVDLQVQTHMPNDTGKEVITTKESIVNEKKELYEKMFSNATRFKG